jgi:hypothetical protein
VLAYPAGAAGLAADLRGGVGQHTNDLFSQGVREAVWMKISPVNFHIPRILWYMYEKGKVS